MTGQILTFTNLFPSAVRPDHGRFVQDRMQRVAVAAGLDWQVVCPVPRVPWLLRRRADRALAAMPPRELVDGVPVHNVHYLHLPGMSRARQAARVARACMPVVRELSRGRPTVLDAHYLYPDGVAALHIARALQLPCVVTARGSDVNVLAEIPVIREQVRSTMHDAARLFAVSSALSGRFADVLGNGSRVETVRNGVDLELYRPGDRAAARRALGLPGDRQVVLGVGRLVEGKGFHHAAAALAGLGGDAVLALVGDGPERERIAGLLAPQRLCLLGARPRDQVILAYQASDLLVLPTYREGWPNVVTEALACGLSVVASAVGGIPEILADDRVGALVPPGDTEALQVALQRFLAAPPDPRLARALAEGYSWDDTVQRLSALFRDLVT